MSSRAGFRRVVSSLGEAHRTDDGGPRRSSTPPYQFYFAILLTHRPGEGACRGLFVYHQRAEAGRSGLPPWPVD